MTETVAPAIPMPAERPTIRFDWRLFAVLWAMNIVASLIIVPYSQSFGEAITMFGEQMSPAMITALLLGSQLACAVLWNGPAIAVGLLAARAIGLGSPMLRALLHREPLPEGTAKILGMAFVVGLVGGAALMGLALLIEPPLNAEMARLGVELPENLNPPPWTGFLASISAGITEESLLRLFLLSALAWIGSRVFRRADGRAPLGVLWAATILATLIFGALHFANAAAMMPLTPLVMGYVLTLNGLIGLLFGWLYWRFGLESAMMAHFSVDIVLHVLAPMFFAG